MWQLADSGGLLQIQQRDRSSSQQTQGDYRFPAASRHQEGPDSQQTQVGYSLGREDRVKARKVTRARRKPFHVDKLYLLGFTELLRRKKPGLKKDWPSGHHSAHLICIFFIWTRDNTTDRYICKSHSISQERRDGVRDPASGYTQWRT